MRPHSSFSTYETRLDAIISNPVSWTILACAIFLGAILACPMLSRIAKAQSEGEIAKGALELVDPQVLRVCADPHNLPSSNETGDGFENHIAKLLAQKLGKSLEYTYYPGSTGFVRQTLNALKCDVIMGLPQGDDSVQGTNPYYQTSFVLVAMKGGGFETVEELKDSRLREAKIGIIAGTPPASYLAMNGLLPNIKSYPLVVDTRYESAPALMMDDLEKGNIDVALLWGPIAGYYAKQTNRPMAIAPLIKEQGGPRMIYRIGMGVRHTDQDWKRRLNTFIAENKDAISRILSDFGVPLLDENNQPITH
jgi:quinoprotein dehydrogenase-associated probable ABC transporter substrate-binding protein